MDVLFLLSRVVFVVPILIGAYRTYVEDHDGTARAFKRGGVPMPDVVAPVVGLAVIGGALMVGFGVVPDLGALLLASGVLASGVVLHQFWTQGTAGGRERELGVFKRNVVVAAAAMILFYLFNQLQGKAGFILTDPLFDKGQ